MFFIYGRRNWESVLNNTEGEYHTFEKFEDETYAKGYANALVKSGWHVTLVSGNEITLKPKSSPDLQESQ